MQNSKVLKIFGRINTILAIFTFYFAIKGIFFNTEDNSMALILFAIICLLNGIKGIQQRSTKVEIIGSFLYR